MLERGARVDMTDKFGNTALAAAEASTSMPNEEARQGTVALLKKAMQQARLFINNGHFTADASTDGRGTRC
mgnify:CR=1 FL=1